MRDFKFSGIFPEKSKINSALASFSKREMMVFSVLVVVLLASTVLILSRINNHFMVSIPSRGGSLSIGMVGSPRFVNPVLATSLVDQDLVKIVYSGLMRKSANGTLIPDLAERYEKSEDGLVYTFTLRDNIHFHDGMKVTTDDVLFTVNQAKESIVQSIHKVNWSGVNVEVLDDKVIEFTLRQPYASFLENATLGIMPAHVWSDSPIELAGANTSPIGSGPYMISKTNKQTSGNIDYYELIPFENFALAKPYIEKVGIHFYSNEDDLIKMLKNKTVEQIGSITPINAKMLEEEGYNVESSVLPRVFGLFFNQNVNQLFLEKSIVQAINEAIDKDKIVEEVLIGYGVIIDNPIPPNMTEYQESKDVKRVPRDEILQKVRDDLETNGWSMGEDGFLEKTKKENGKNVTTSLAFSISTGNAPELVQTAELIREDLVAVGMNVDVKTFETGNLNQSVIRPRKYDALLFGQIINNESDLFAFWHSSQRKDPGLNVALYTNVKVDKILEDAFITLDKEERIGKYLEFKAEIEKDMPAIFLYSPSFVYVASNTLKEPPVGSMVSSAERYLNIYSWYSQTESVWEIFN